MGESNTVTGVKLWIMGAVITLLLTVSGWLIVDKMTTNDNDFASVNIGIEELSQEIKVLREDVLVKLAYIDGKNSVQDAAIESNSKSIIRLESDIDEIRKQVLNQKNKTEDD